MPHGGLLFFALPLVVGVAVGITLYAFYNSQQEEERQRRRENSYETRQQPDSNPRRGARRKSFASDRSREQTPSSKICTICIESDVADLTMLPCGHWFHHYCLRNLALNGSNHCPNCRKEF